MDKSKKKNDRSWRSIRNSINTRRYRINGRIYRFLVKDIIDGREYAVCYKTKMKGFLFPGGILLDDKSFVEGEKLD